MQGSLQKARVITPANATRRSSSIEGRKVRPLEKRSFVQSFVGSAIMPTPMRHPHTLSPHHEVDEPRKLACRRRATVTAPVFAEDKVWTVHQAQRRTTSAIVP